MKYWLFSLPLFLATIAVACTNDQLRSDTSIVDKIAADPLYEAYQTAVTDQSINIATGQYDLEGMKHILGTATQSLCEIPDSELMEIRGGVLYKKSDCAIQEAADNLKEKFPDVFNLPEEQREAIQKKYRELTHDRDRRELLNHAIPSQ